MSTDNKILAKQMLSLLEAKLGRFPNTADFIAEFGEEKEARQELFLRTALVEEYTQRVLRRLQEELGARELAKRILTPPK